MNLDTQTFKVLCPHCTKPVEITVSQAKRNATVTCTSCGRSIEIEADQFRREIAKVEKALTDLKRQLGNFGIKLLEAALAAAKGALVGADSEPDGQMLHATIFSIVGTGRFGSVAARIYAQSTSSEQISSHLKRPFDSRSRLTASHA